MGPLMILPFRGHYEAVAYLMSKAGADAIVSALMYLWRPGTKKKFMSLVGIAFLLE